VLGVLFLVAIAALIVVGIYVVVELVRGSTR
jgi:hypothetical protein